MSEVNVLDTLESVLGYQGVMCNVVITVSVDWESNITFGDNVVFTVAQGFGRNTVFGDNCIFASTCGFGEHCTFGKYCVFGKAIFGDSCHFSSYSTFYMDVFCDNYIDAVLHSYGIVHKGGIQDLLSRGVAGKGVESAGGSQRLSRGQKYGVVLYDGKMERGCIKAVGQSGYGLYVMSLGGGLYAVVPLAGDRGSEVFADYLRTSAVTLGSLEEMSTCVVVSSVHFGNNCTFSSSINIYTTCNIGSGSTINSFCNVVRAYVASGCSVQSKCKFGDMQCSGDTNFGMQNSFGRGSTFYNTCTFGHKCKFGDTVKFWSKMTFKDACSFGNNCAFSQNSEYDITCTRGYITDVDLYADIVDTLPICVQSIQGRHIINGSTDLFMMSDDWFAELGVTNAARRLRASLFIDTVRCMDMTGTTNDMKLSYVYPNAECGVSCMQLLTRMGVVYVPVTDLECLLSSREYRKLFSGVHGEQCKTDIDVTKASSTCTLSEYKQSLVSTASKARELSRTSKLMNDDTVTTCEYSLSKLQSLHTSCGAVIKLRSHFSRISRDCEDAINTFSNHIHVTMSQRAYLIYTVLELCYRPVWHESGTGVCFATIGEVEQRLIQTKLIEPVIQPVVYRVVNTKDTSDILYVISVSGLYGYAYVRGCSSIRCLFPLLIKLMCLSIGESEFTARSTAHSVMKHLGKYFKSDTDFVDVSSNKYEYDMLSHDVQAVVTAHYDTYFTGFVNGMEFVADLLSDATSITGVSLISIRHGDYVCSELQSSFSEVNKDFGFGVCPNIAYDTVNKLSKDAGGNMWYNLKFVKSRL